MNYSVRNIVIAAGLALLAVVAVVLYTSSVQSKAKSAEVRVKVLVATRDIEPGTTFAQIRSGHMLAEHEVLQTDMLPGVLTQAAFDGDRYSGQVVSQKLFSGQQVPGAVFTSKIGATAGLQLQGTDRAIAFPFNKEQGLVGTLHAGDKVDVIACYNCANSGGNNTVPVTRILLHDIEVLQVPSPDDKPASGSTSDSSTIMLKATDVEAAKLLWVQQNAVAWLVARPTTNGRNSDVNSTVQDYDLLLRESLNAKTIKKLGLVGALIGGDGSGNATTTTSTSTAG
jgi:Flp pilus assembly protein CpaB